MSHTCTIKIQCKDESLVASVCKSLGLAAPVKGTHELYASSVEGLAVKLPGWTYPAVINTCTGELSYDNYGGKWGDIAALNKFTQHYGAALYEREMRKKGYMIQKSTNKDGSIRVKAVQYA